MIENPITTYVEPVVDKTTTRKAVVPWIPRGEADLANLGVNAATEMKISSLTVIHFTWEELLAESTEYKDSFVQTSNQKSSRTPVSKQLTALNDEITINIEHPKNYLYETYGANDKNYYAALDIKKTSKGYKISRDYQECIIALEKIVAFAKSEGWDNKVYNADYWQDILDRYRPLVAMLSGTAGKVSVMKSGKDDLKKSLITKLQCVMHLVRANYPKDPEAMLRNWGFQRETFK